MFWLGFALGALCMFASAVVLVIVTAANSDKWMRTW